MRPAYVAEALEIAGEANELEGRGAQGGQCLSRITVSKRLPKNKGAGPHADFRTGNAAS
jgi:hypothetical protein